jgi:hypothetical protein
MNPDVRQYAEWGYHLVPWYNRNASHPKPLIQGWQDDKPSVESVAEFAERWPECDWAIVPKGAIVLDLENKNGKNGMDDLRILCEEHGVNVDELISAYPMSSTPNNGFHLWMRLSEGSNLTGGFYLRSGIEIKGGQSSAHVPPSVGRSWVRPLVEQSEIPCVPTWMMVELFKAKQTKKQVTSFSVAKISNGHRRDWLLSCAGKIRQDFAATDQELRGILKVLRDTRCEDPHTLTDDEVHAIADDYAEKLCDNTHALAIAGDPVAQHAIKMFAPRVAVVEESKRVVEAGKYLDEKFVRPTPMIAAWMDWYHEKCVMEQPELALLSILTAVSAMIGRSYTWKDSQANIYSLCLGGTGVGKEMVKRVSVEMLEQSGLGFMIGSGSFASDAGMLREMSTNPEIFWPNDEFQTFVSQLALIQAPPYVKSIERVLTEGYTGSISGRALKTEQHDDIKDPYPVILALSQPETFWKAMNLRMVESGFLGRFLILSARPLRDSGDGNAKLKMLPPEELVETVKRGVAGKSALTARAEAGSAATRIPMGSTPEADELFTRLRREDKTRRAEMDESSFAAKMAARTLEKAIRVAMCYAWTENPETPVVSEKALAWAVEFVRYCDRRMIESMEQNTAGNPYEQALKKVKAMIAASSVNGVGKHTIVSKTTEISDTTRDDILRSLVAANTVVETRKVGPKGGRPVVRYTLKEYNTDESES